eukprot:335060-Chlamydomonas_euryale.AAC.1
MSEVGAYQTDALGPKPNLQSDGRSDSDSGWVAGNSRSQRSNKQQLGTFWAAGMHFTLTR